MNSLVHQPLEFPRRRRSLMPIEAEYHKTVVIAAGGLVVPERAVDIFQAFAAGLPECAKARLGQMLQDAGGVIALAKSNTILDLTLFSPIILLKSSFFFYCAAYRSPTPSALKNELLRAT